MSPTVHIAMFGWIPLGLFLFVLLPVRRAIIAAYLVGWLFLPQAGYALSGLPDYTRMTAVNAVVLMGVLLFDSAGLGAFRMRIWDLPMLVWVLCPFATSVSNDLGAYDGLSGVLDNTLAWGVPYLLGRTYFQSPETVRMLAIGVFIGGLIYLPLCLWEIRMSPQLHRFVYGFHPGKFNMTWRLGGYRPVAFMSHGIALGLWMAVTSLGGIWLWRARAVKRLWGIPMAWLAMPLLVTTVLCRSLGGLALLALGLGVLLMIKLTRSGWPLLAFALVPPLYVGVRATGVWYPHVLVNIANRIDADRAVSLESRLGQEEILRERAWRRPVFGWASWGRNRVLNEEGKWATATDSLWIIVFGQQGLVGLISLGALFVLPSLLLIRTLHGHSWSAAGAAPAVVLAVGIAMYAGDRLMNAMPNPYFHLMVGSIIGLALSARKAGGAVRSPVWKQPASWSRRVASSAERCR